MQKGSTAPSATTQFHSRPENDQLEIVVFGPSYGECILVHLGSQRWMVVDSCRDPDTKRQVAIQYFERIGIRSESIACIVASHWDDDHTAGLAELLTWASKAMFVMPAAIYSKELIALVEFYERTDFGIASGLREFRGVLKVLMASNRIPKLALENVVLPLHCHGQQLATVRALSPANAVVIEGHLAMKDILDTVTRHRLKLPRVDKNRYSIVLHVEMGGTATLLGGDLLEEPSATTGWKAAVETGRALRKGKAVKVPHHGSITGHSDAMWTELLEPNSVALLAPWKLGGDSLPVQSDLERILRFSPEVYITSIPQNRPTKLSSSVQDIIKRLPGVVSVRNPFTARGAIRISWNKERGAWEVVLLGEARKIENRLFKAFPK